MLAVVLVDFRSLTVAALLDLSLVIAHWDILLELGH